MELVHEFSFAVIPIMICISAVAGRVSLRPRYFTGWYETFHDIKTLTSLILCSTVLFVSSVLLMLLLIFSPGTRWREENAKNATVIFLVYLFTVVGLFCLPNIRDRRRRRQNRSNKQTPDFTVGEGYNFTTSSEESFSTGYENQQVVVEENDTGGDSDIKKDILQFLCTFNLAFCVQFFLLLLVLYGVCLNNGCYSQSGSLPSNLWTCLSDGSLGAITTYNCDLFILVLLLALTSGTGSLLSAIGIDYRKDGAKALTNRARNRSRTNLNELIKLIRSR